MTGRAIISSLLILLATGGALALAGPGGRAAGTAAADKPPADRLESDELARISIESLPSVARDVEKVRELRFDGLPEPEVVTSEYLNRLGARELERQGGDLGIGADQAVGRISGLIADGEDIGAVYESTGDLAAAAYDTRTKRLYVVSDAVAANRALVEFVLAHELDHALEDQHFGIGGGGKLTDDGALARQALTEGSATDVMIEFGARFLNPLELLAASGAIDSGTGDVPKAIVDQLMWTYLGGRKFIATLRDYAGGGWKLVDYALEARPPETTEQVLHPRKFILDEEPAAVRIDGSDLRAAGWHLADRSVWGELATSHLLKLGLEVSAAKTAAEGWGGDRYELWRREVAPGACEYPCRADLVLAQRWDWDTPADAAEFARAVPAYLEAGLGAEPLDGGTWRLEGGYAAFAKGDTDTALVLAPELGLARSVAAAQASD